MPGRPFLLPLLAPQPWFFSIPTDETLLYVLVTSCLDYHNCLLAGPTCLSPPMGSKCCRQNNLAACVPQPHSSTFANSSLSLFRGITHSQPSLAASLPPLLASLLPFLSRLLLICHHRAFRYEGTIHRDDSSTRKFTLLGTGAAARTKAGGSSQHKQNSSIKSWKHLEEKGSRGASKPLFRGQSGKVLLRPGSFSLLSSFSLVSFLCVWVVRSQLCFNRRLTTLSTQRRLPTKSREIKCTHTFPISTSYPECEWSFKCD